MLLAYNWVGHKNLSRHICMEKGGKGTCTCAPQGQGGHVLPRGYVLPKGQGGMCSPGGKGGMYSPGGKGACTPRGHVLSRGHMSPLPPGSDAYVAQLFF